MAQTVTEAGELEKKKHLLMPGYDLWPQTALEKKGQMGHMGIGALKEEMHMRLLELLDFGEPQRALDERAAKTLGVEILALAVVQHRMHLEQPGFALQQKLRGMKVNKVLHILWLSHSWTLPGLALGWVQ